jgi:hypothetical protein
MKRAKMIDASFQVDTLPDSGTMITLVVPY